MENSISDIVLKNQNRSLKNSEYSHLYHSKQMLYTIKAFIFLQKLKILFFRHHHFRHFLELKTVQKLRAKIFCI